MVAFRHLRLYDINRQMEPKEDKPSVAQLRSLLNRTTRIKITDGRLFVGQFMCIDHSKNIILSAAQEYRMTTPDSAKGINGSGNKAGSAGDRDIPLKTLSTNAPQDTIPNTLDAGYSRNKEEGGKLFEPWLLVHS
jgi:small nuclear ribonucleoprotein (snRNP)-like protein